MAITSAICSSFKQELLQGKHSFESSGGHTFKLALFDSDASLGASTTDYSTSEEITNTSGSAYSAGGATGNSDTTSGRITLAPTPDQAYNFRIHYNVMPATLESGNQTNYISLNFPNGLLYCCLSETYGFLKGPIDMLTLYENKYKQEVQKFANEQVGRRRRDDYTDGAVRIPVNSANP